MKVNALQCFLAMNIIIRALPSNGQLRFANHLGSRHRSTAAAEQPEFGRDDFAFSMSMSMLMGGDIELDTFLDGEVNVHKENKNSSKASKPNLPTPNVSHLNLALHSSFV
jgi:hypothetical protein